MNQPYLLIAEVANIRAGCAASLWDCERRAKQRQSLWDRAASPLRDGIQLATRRVPCPQMGRLFALAILVQPMDLSYERRLELSAHSILEKHKAPDQFPSIIPFRFVL